MQALVANLRSIQTKFRTSQVFRVNITKQNKTKDPSHVIFHFENKKNNLTHNIEITYICNSATIYH